MRTRGQARVEQGANNTATLPDLTGEVVATDASGPVMLLTVSDSASNQTTRAVAVIVPGQPHIALQPANLTLASSSNAAFSVLACGAAPLLYQWQHSSTNLPSATNVVLTLNDITTNNAGAYAVVLTNPAGSSTSAVATLTVLQPPVINSLSFNSSTFMLTIPTEVGPTYVVEYKKDLEDPSWTVLATLSGTGSSIPITDNGLTNTTRFYRVRVR